MNRIVKVCETTIMCPIHVMGGPEEKKVRNKRNT